MFTKCKFSVIIHSIYTVLTVPKFAISKAEANYTILISHDINSLT